MHSKNMTDGRVEAAKSLENELAAIDWQHSMTQRTVVFWENEGSHFEQLPTIILC